MSNPKNPEDAPIGEIVRTLGRGAPEGAPLGAPEVTPGPDWARAPRTVKSYEIAGFLKKMVQTNQQREALNAITPLAQRTEEDEAYKNYRLQQMQEAADAVQTKSMQSIFRLTAQDLERAKETAGPAFQKMMTEARQAQEQDMRRMLSGLGLGQRTIPEPAPLTKRGELFMRAVASLGRAFELTETQRVRIQDAIQTVLTGSETRPVSEPEPIEALLPASRLINLDE